MKRSRPAFWILDYRNARIRLEINNAWDQAWSDVFWARTRATPYKTNMHCILPRQICHAEKQPIVQISVISVSQLNCEDFDYVPCGISFQVLLFIRFEKGYITSYANYILGLTILNKPQMRISLDSKIWALFTGIFGPSDVFNKIQPPGPVRELSVHDVAPPAPHGSLPPAGVSPSTYC